MTRSCTKKIREQCVPWDTKVISPLSLHSSGFCLKLGVSDIQILSVPVPAWVAVRSSRPRTPLSPSAVCDPLPLCLQTYIGSIIASVNPYKTINGLYERTTMERYSKCHLGELPPHIFAVANECYRCLWKRHDNQCILIR